MTQRDKVVVTGGAGFIGSWLVAKLIQEGYQIVVVDNFSNGDTENLKNFPPDCLTIITGDVRAPSMFFEELRNAKCIYHLACLGLRHSLHSPLENHDVNATGTLQLLQAAKKAGVPRFVHVSTSEVYGSAIHVPMNENHPTRPATVYGASKLAGESYARAFHSAGEFDVTVLRPFNAYGPRSHYEGDAGEVIPKFILRILAGLPAVIFGDGSQQRDFTYVEDIANGIMEAGRTIETAGKTLNLGSGIAISIRHHKAFLSNPHHRPSRPVAAYATRLNCHGASFNKISLSFSSLRMC